MSPNTPCIKLLGLGFVYSNALILRFTSEALFRTSQSVSPSKLSHTDYV